VSDKENHAERRIWHDPDVRLERETCEGSVGPDDDKLYCSLCESEVDESDAQVLGLCPRCAARIDTDYEQWRDETDWLQSLGDD
jgi:predicted amidophosphoribosyltransferase